jgi:hypothetical protein
MRDTKTGERETMAKMKVATRKAAKPVKKAAKVKCEFVCPTCGDRCERTDARDHGTGENLCEKHFHLVHQAGGA